MSCIMVSRKQFGFVSKTSFSVWRYFYSRNRILANQNLSGFLSEADYRKVKDNKKSETVQPNTTSLIARRLLESAPHTKAGSTYAEPMKLREINLNEATSRDVLKERLDVISQSFENTMSSIIKVEQPAEKEDADALELIAFEEDMRGIIDKPSPLRGTEDPSVEPGDIPCSGCGALLQCSHRILPGFMVSELYKLLSRGELKKSICQRCHYMRHCDAFIEVKVNSEDYADMISKIQPTKSLVVMVVDMMDVWGSIVPRLKQYIGPKHPLIIVGNKADLLAPDSDQYLVNAFQHLRKTCKKAGLTNILSYNLISAKTGFGIERLISKLFTLNNEKLDIYIVGTANSGKSSLFNILLGSDYCKNSARGLIQRATVSQWPGTTLNLLKFPVTRLTDRDAKLRFQRLKQEKALRLEKRRLDKEKREMEEQKEWELSVDIKTTDLRDREKREKDIEGKAWGQAITSFEGQSGDFLPALDDSLRVEYTPENYEKSQWTYDTPGIINPKQIVNYLTPEECVHVSPSAMIIPRSAVLHCSQTIFVSGLARIDYLEGSSPLLITVHTASALPLRVGPLESADAFYEEHVGSDVLLVPTGDKERLSKLPALSGKYYTITGSGTREAVADVQLSSVGWVSLTAEKGQEVKVKAWTPGAVGLHLSLPSLQPEAHRLRGRRLRDTPFYATNAPGSAMLGRDFVRLGEDWDEAWAKDLYRKGKKRH